MARAYLDQLNRDNGIAHDRSAAIADALNRAEHESGAARQTSLTQLATALDSDAQSASDGAKVRLLAAAVRKLASA